MLGRSSSQLSTTILCLVESDRKRQILNDITHTCNLRKNTNESIYKTETDSHRKQTCAYQQGEGRGEGQIRGMGLTNYYI